MLYPCQARSRYHGASIDAKETKICNATAGRNALYSLDKSGLLYRVQSKPMAPATEEYCIW